MKKIAIFTAARSDFGILKNLILKIEKDKRFNLDLIVNPAHTSSKFGETIKEINEIKIKNKIYLNFEYKNSNTKSIISYFTNIVKEIANYIESKNPKAVIIMGDRYEMMACAFSVLQYNIPIIHLCGGSVTMGSLDNIYRDNISRIAKLHLVESCYHKNRLKNIGVNKNVYIVGAPALENINKFKYLSFSEISKKFNLNINKQKKIIIACFHPETNISVKKNINNLKKFLIFLKSLHENIIFTYPNADDGFNIYIKYIKKYLGKMENCSILKNLGIKNYYIVLKNSDIMIGNSSSGIIESASFKLPVINIGDRQKNRFSNQNVIHTSFDVKDLKKAFLKSKSPVFLKKLSKLQNFYYQKNTSQKCANVIYRFIK